MANSFKDTNHASHISRRVHFVINCEKLKMHRIDWCEVCLKLVGIATKNVGESYLNTIMKYIMVILDN